MGEGIRRHAHVTEPTGFVYQIVYTGFGMTQRGTVGPQETRRRFAEVQVSLTFVGILRQRTREN